MDANRIDCITAKYVWAIQSDGIWHSQARPECVIGNYGKFRRVTGNFINNIELKHGERLQNIEWAYVLLELWVGLGGNRTYCLSDPGTLRSQYEELLHLVGEEVPKVELVRRKGDLYATYGAIYTYKSTSTARQGRAYCKEEAAFIKDQYQRGMGFELSANSLRRTALGICEKMRQMGLIERNSEGDYICTKDVEKKSVTNPCGEIELNELPREISEHINSAAGHFDRIATALESIQQEKHTMNINPNIAIETKTVIFGLDAANMTDQQLIDAIKRVEGDISKLKEVKTKSKKIASNIAELESNLDAIVAVLDAR